MTHLGHMLCYQGPGKAGGTFQQRAAERNEQPLQEGEKEDEKHSFMCGGHSDWEGSQQRDSWRGRENPGGQARNLGRGRSPMIEKMSFLPHGDARERN